MLVLCIPIFTGPSFEVYLGMVSTGSDGILQKISAPHRLIETYQIPHFRLDKLYLLKVHKRENFLGSDMEICTFS